ncbi:hypothetical protein [Amycolatopsis regifaucium]|uniref:Uncharacterized protein n=1 Tax=Amycolatopsis regifaucium TaxID=546365 RepID=A0A154MA51_9PSEU|nr:hypothetical protein [Amycolatopsis regifaucium]KZB81432.1 hypothetical protein AVL48_05300 [Amycolatopsis regifaucium]OKA04697.1 hypothetical protein ATP06_0230315 [Amycolatopsis regifaucium]SFH31544.1 hypothetical protein SAMN04489731_103487 [Amycolatopsis regifaucium]
MTEEVRNRPLEMPRRLKFVRGFLWLQAVLNILVSALVTMVAMNELDHGNEEAGLALVLALLGFVVAVVLIASAVRISRGAPWVRVAVIVVEALTVVIAVIGLINGGPITQLIGMGIAIGIIVTLNKPEERAWFTR